MVSLVDRVKAGLQSRSEDKKKRQDINREAKQAEKEAYFREYRRARIIQAQTKARTRARTAVQSSNPLNGVFNHTAFSDVGGFLKSSSSSANRILQSQGIGFGFGSPRTVHARSSRPKAKAHGTTIAIDGHVIRIGKAHKKVKHKKPSAPTLDFLTL